MRRTLQAVSFLRCGAAPVSQLQTGATGVNASHETPAEVQRHTKDAEDKAPARSGAQKRRRASQGWLPLAQPPKAATAKLQPSRPDLTTRVINH